MTHETPLLCVDGVSKAFTVNKTHFQAMDTVDMDVAEGEFVSVVGPSGCGKSTLFNTIAGLFKPDTGRVMINGEDVSGRTGHVGYMLQRDLLVPWRTVLHNVVLCKEIEGFSGREVRERAMELLNRFGLGQFANQYPDGLSGGMRQRVAMIRTILSDKNLFLLDEPFGALDAQTRTLMQEWLLDVCSEFRKTVVFITHDIDEAIYLSDRIYIMSARPGRMLANIEVPIPRPRDAHVRVDSTYIDIKTQVLGTIREQSLAAMHAQ